MRFLYLLTIWSTIGYSQKPVIFPGGVVNAASYEPANTTQNLGKNLSPGSIISIFGVHLALSPQAATTIPLPIQLAGTSVVVNGVSAPLLYVSPGQINFQMPTGGGGDGLVVTTATAESDPYSFGPSYAGSTGVFTNDASGCGQGAVLNVRGLDGALSLNSPSSGVAPGDYVSLFGTGIYVERPPPDGTPSPVSPLTPAYSYTGAAFDLASYAQLGYFPKASWAGLAPGLIGVDQINVQVPSSVREGCAVPVQVINGGISQPVTISIRQGGGSCADPPSAGYGRISWEKTVVTSATGTATETDLLTMSLQASPGKQAPPPATFAEGTDSNKQLYFGPSCQVAGYHSLGAGTVSARGPGFGPIQATIAPLQEGQVSGLTEYQASLPNGSIQPGSFTVAAAGGADVASFQSSVQIGSGIQVTTALAGKVISGVQPLTINWTGGDSNSWVTLTVVVHNLAMDQSRVLQAHASDGAITVGNACIQTTCSLGVLGNGEIILEVTPDPAITPSFSAPGMSLGGTHLWKYTYRFEGVQLQ